MVFQKVRYLHLEVDGDGQERALAFARAHEEGTIVVIVPRLSGSRVLGKAPGESKMFTPQELQGAFEDVFTTRQLVLGESLALDDLFSHFPVAVLRRL